MDASHLIVDAGRAAFVDGAFIFSTTSPTQFDAVQPHASIDLHSDIDVFVRIVRSCRTAT
jgi:hypothetical protein